jgi:transposase
MPTSYIGADVDSKITNLAIERNGQIVQELAVPTTIPALRGALSAIAGRKEVVIEEGLLAHWLWRNLRDCVHRFVVCDPRRNAYVAKDGDKADPIDARKLAELLRGGYVREVYHSENDKRVLLKRWAGLYHDRVREAVRQINKVRACCALAGVRPPRGALRDPDVRCHWLEQLPRDLAEQLTMLWMGLDTAIAQSHIARGQLRRRAKGCKILKLWQELPGVGEIRATTLLAYLDTPWRFRRPEPLWKYCGVGLQRASSGKDRQGRPKVGRLQLVWQCNRRLKDAVMGAAISAVRQGNNVFSKQYERLVDNGLTPGNARHTVARKMLTVMWGMWKTEQPFDPSQVLGPVPSEGSRRRRCG